MKSGTIRHRKVYDLAGILSVRRAEAIGILTGLWELTAEQFPDGDVSRAPLPYLAEFSLWDSGRGQELINALIKSELLDPLPDGRLYVHDWHDHCENTVHRKLWRRKAWFANGLPPKITTLDGQDKEAARKWYAEHKPPEFQRNSNGIPTECLRLPAVAVAEADTEAVASASAEAEPPAAAPAGEQPPADSVSDCALAQDSVSDSDSEEPEIRSDVVILKLEGIFGRNGNAKQFKADRTTFARLADTINAGKYDHLAKGRFAAVEAIVRAATGFARDRTVHNPVAAFVAWCKTNAGP